MEYRFSLVFAAILGLFMTILVGCNPDSNKPGSGSLDMSFGTGGKVTTSFSNIAGQQNDRAYTMAVQPDGKILLAGGSSATTPPSIALARYNPNGSLDTGFGSDGKVTTAIESRQSYVTAIAVQSDGKILVAGDSYIGSDYVPVLVRYNSNGSLDSTFNGVGSVYIPGMEVAGHSLAVQPDGMILMEGMGSNKFVLGRYTVNGQLDIGFGTGGLVSTAVGSSQDRANALVLQPDGKIVLGGISSDGLNFHFALVRYTTNGSLDTNFGVGGKKVTQFSVGGDDWGFSLALQPDGKILLGGESKLGWLELARYTPDGSLDSGFGEGGKVFVSHISNLKCLCGGFWDSLVLQADGKILIAGSAWSGADDSSPLGFALIRLKSDGSLDTGFGKDGQIISPVTENTDYYAYAMVLQPDQKILVGGYGISSNTQFAMVRYNP